MDHSKDYIDLPVFSREEEADLHYWMRKYDCCPAPEGYGDEPCPEGHKRIAGLGKNLAKLNLKWPKGAPEIDLDL